MRKLLAIMLSLVMVSALAFAKPATQLEFTTMNKADSQFLFKDGAKAFALDKAEMEKTKGEGWFLPLVWRIGSYGFRLAYHEAHHTFKFFGRSRHLQLNMWKHGVKGSGRTIFRIPWQWWKR